VAKGHRYMALNVAFCNSTLFKKNQKKPDNVVDETIIKKTKIMAMRLMVLSLVINPSPI
jgi:hypothetical protein